MPDPIRFEVIGIPAPQGSKTAMMLGGKARVIDGSSTTGRAKHRAWRQDVHEVAAQVAQDCPEAPLDEPLLVRITFRFPLTADRHRTRHTVKPDVDKAIRATFDALTTAGLIRDDSIIYAIQATKTYARGTPSGATIEIERHGDTERADRTRSIEVAKRARKEAKQGKQA